MNMKMLYGVDSRSRPIVTKVALYARVSKTDKSQNPETQLVRLREYSENQGFEVFSEYIDRASGADPFGPNLNV